MTKTKTQKSWYIDMAIVIAIYALFQFILPAPEPITRAGMGVAGIFIATLYLWIKVDIGWPSLLFVGVVGLTGVCSGTNLFAKTWGNVMVPFLVCAFMLNMVMSETGPHPPLRTRLRYCQGQPRQALAHYDNVLPRSSSHGSCFHLLRYLRSVHGYRRGNVQHDRLQEGRSSC